MIRESRGTTKPTGSLALAAVLLTSFVVGCGAVSTDPAASGSTTTDVAPRRDATRTSEQGQVTITVTWQGSSSAPAFVVTMDTHSIDLDRYDLATLATLKTGAGLELQPIAWDAPKGGHHRGGTLVFPATPADGGVSIDADALTMTLVIRDVAGVPERIFQWTL